MRIHVRVISRAKQAEVKQLRDNYLRIKVCAVPIKDRANQELISLLAKYYNVEKSAVKILKGKHSKNKLIEISVF